MTNKIPKLSDKIKESGNDTFSKKTYDAIDHIQDLSYSLVDTITSDTLKVVIADTTVNIDLYNRDDVDLPARTYITGTSGNILPGYTDNDSAIREFSSGGNSITSPTFYVNATNEIRLYNRGDEGVPNSTIGVGNTSNPLPFWKGADGTVHDLGGTAPSNDYQVQISGTWDSDNKYVSFPNADVVSECNKLLLSSETPLTNIAGVAGFFKNKALEIRVAGSPFTVIFGSNTILYSGAQANVLRADETNPQTNEGEYSFEGIFSNTDGSTITNYYTKFVINSETSEDAKLLCRDNTNANLNWDTSTSYNISIIRDPLIVSLNKDKLIKAIFGAITDYDKERNDASIVKKDSLNLLNKHIENNSYHENYMNNEKSKVLIPSFKKFLNSNRAFILNHKGNFERIPYLVDTYIKQELNHLKNNHINDYIKKYYEKTNLTAK